MRMKNGCLKRWVLNACLGVKVYSKGAVGMSGTRAKETIYSGQNGYYWKKNNRQVKIESARVPTYDKQ